MEENRALLVGTSSYGLKRLQDDVWTEYTTTNSDLPSNSITSIEVAPSGLIHMSSGGNLVTFDGDTFISDPIPMAWSSSSLVRQIAFDGSGTCYVTTLTYETGPPDPPEVRHGRLLKLVDGVWTDLNHPDPGSGYQTLGPLTIDSANVVWSGSNRLVTYADGIWSMSTLPSCGFAQNGVLDIHCAKDGGVWANIHELYVESIYRFDGTAWVDRTVGLPATVSIFDVVTDTLGNPILATQLRGALVERHGLDNVQHEQLTSAIELRRASFRGSLRGALGTPERERIAEVRRDVDGLQYGEHRPEQQ